MIFVPMGIGALVYYPFLNYLTKMMVAEPFHQQETNPTKPSPFATS
jgi:hypothetical protein